MSVALEAQGLGKRFGTVEALRDLTLSIPLGGVYGVLGPNGAGKSTLFRIALGLVRPSSGSVKVLGAERGDIKALRRTGSVIENPHFPPYLTGRQALQFLAAASGARTVDFQAWLDRVELSEAADRVVKGYSVGMKQRLGLAAALMTGPQAVILDEPTSGMDPVGIADMRKLIRELADKDGVTIILASHQLDEVQRLCDRVAILDKGRLAAEGAVDALTAASRKLRIEASPVAKVLDILGERGQPDGRDAVLATVTRAEAPALIRALAAAGVDLTEARWVGGELETAFRFHTGGTVNAG
ncbi:ABC-2 type transport system ATP-binding protein [Caulobacter ginsengisoli]|uniref:ABC-2 type transport system ATP-binding protein n=1 Tax=Caulobacter ginsengisoli TaxID=400775 RepID=A0ABU0IL79_9CAUL|nr:ABC transporter ATP-binding protein [Caulobacter ginsengisoli]MDQ0462768.1 ABC-2 type transport system ATP-binding protein [Caulobacter ginsengisoli]